MSGEEAAEMTGELSDVESRVLRQLTENERLTFEELNNQLTDIPEEQLEEAVRNLLHTQRLAETGDWNYYATEVHA